MTKRIVVLTGAGMSAESGIRTFRDNDGLWQNHRVEEVASPIAWASDMDLVLQGALQEIGDRLNIPDIEVRMGSGKGAPEGWVAVVKPGKIMFEVGGVSEDVAREALRLASHKLPIRTKFVKREEIGGESNEG